MMKTTEKNILILRLLAERVRMVRTVVDEFRKITGRSIDEFPSADDLDRMAQLMERDRDAMLKAGANPDAAEEA